MNAIQTTSSQPVSSDIRALREDLNAHIDYGTYCNEFFNLYSTPKRNQAKDFPDAHYNYMGFFSKMFSSISDNKLLQWKEAYQTIAKKNLSIASNDEKKSIPIEMIDLKISEDTSSIISIEEKGSVQDELAELKIKIELIEKTNEVFCKKMVALIQNNAKVLLKEEHIFFLASLSDLNGGIGECHCCGDMSREKRNQFSEGLIGEIVTAFPDKKSISIASIGAGTCFQELEIHSLAQKEGYEVSEWILVDPTLQSKTTKNFTTIVKWITPNTTVTAVSQKAHEYFNGLQNCNSAPDVFLFIDVDLHIQESEVQDYSQNLNHVGLFAYFAKNQAHGAEYYDSKVSL